MMRGTFGRIRSLEREVRRREGCPTCRGRDVVGVVEDGPWPAWLDELACCRACGRGVKLIDRGALDAV